MEDDKTVNKIGQNFSTWQLFIFALPAFFMNVFTQLFKSLDDALFISRYVGSSALAGLNLLNPIMLLQLGICHLFSLGSSNISAKLMGEGKQDEAKQVFTKIVISSTIVGIIFALIINIFAKPILVLLKADEALAHYAMYQIRVVYSITPITIISAVFSAYFSTAGKPKVGMICSLANGFTNIGLDILLVAVLKMGVLGACLATIAGDIVVFIIGMIFYINDNNEIHFIKPVGEYVHTCIQSFLYALPQAVNSWTIGLTFLITNYQLLNIIGSDGVAANAIISDIRSILTSGLFGITTAIAPIIAYNYGSKNVKRLKKTLIDVVIIWFVGSSLLMLSGFILRTPLVKLFMSKDSTQAFFDMAMFGLTIEIFSIPFSAACVTITRGFIALGNPKASTANSVFRNLITKVICLTILPLLFKATGIWLAMPVSEAIAFLFGLLLIYLNRNNYGYGRSGLHNMIN